jgi:PAS domain S-box-containing protein
VNEGFLTLDTASKVRFANARILQMLEAAEDEIVGRDIFDYLATEDRVRLLNLLAKSSAADPAENRQELRLVTAAGEAIPVLVGVSYLREASASDAVYSLVVTNVSDLKDMQHELAERADELERANEELLLHDRAKDSFLSNVSHELRTPLATVQGYIEMLASGTLGEPYAPQKNAYRVMQRNIERLLALINEMIDFSRMEIRGVSLKPSLYLPGKLIQDGVASFVPQAAAKGVALFAEDDTGACAAWGDRERLGQAIAILINNALKFTAANGEVHVRAGRLDNDTLYISVSDTGIGIEPAYQEKVFDKFFQVDSSKSRRYEGAGIGLSIAKSIVEAHAGAISVRSAVGQGSTFTIMLPECIFDAPGALQYDGPASIIMIDEPGILSEAFEQLLGTDRLQVRQVSGAAHCLREAEERIPGLIVINDGPDDIAGEVSVGLLKRDPVSANVPLLVLTAEPMSRYEELATRWQGIQFMPKPFTPQELARALGAATGEALSQDALGLSLATAEPVPRPRPQVMVVDSDPGLLEWVEMAFAGRNVLCYCAATVSAALQLVEKDPPNVLFVDIDAPGSHAVEQVIALAHAPGLAGKPVYVMTGTRERFEPVNGIRGVLRKPFTIGQMLALVPSDAIADK